MRSKTSDVARRLLHMRDNIQLAIRFIENQGYEMFRDDTRTLYATIRCLEIISEASRHLPPELKERHPKIAWRDISGAGNVYRHDYEDVIAQRVWATVKKDLPPLLLVVAQELEGIAT